MPPSTEVHTEESQLGVATTDQRERLRTSCRRAMPRQRRIGLTGGIASGKSSVGRWLTGQGIPVLDADVYAHEALAPAQAASHAVVRRYGTEVIRAGSDPETAELDRAALAAIVFSDPTQRQWLEELVHPLVCKRFETALNRLQSEATVALMIPLLFEAGLETLCTEVWVVHCSPEQQIKRLAARNGLTADVAKQRINAQWPLAKKVALADRVIDNSGEPEAWRTEASQLLAAG